MTRAFLQGVLAFAMILWLLISIGLLHDAEQYGNHVSGIIGLVSLCAWMGTFSVFMRWSLGGD